jgi:hypothetical protein
MQAPRYVGVGQQIRHDHDAIHRRADFMAHGGEKVGFGVVRFLGGVAGAGQLARTVDDLLLESRPVCRQTLVAITDVAQHRVEALDQKADLLIRRLLDVHVVTMVSADLLHGRQQTA